MLKEYKGNRDLANKNKYGVNPIILYKLRYYSINDEPKIPFPAMISLLVWLVFLIFGGLKNDWMAGLQ